MKKETRHGAAAGLRAILKKHATGAGKINLENLDKKEEASSSTSTTTDSKPTLSHKSQAQRNREWLEDCVVRLVCVMALDRFEDHSSDIVVTPVKETVAQTIGKENLLSC